MTALAALLTSAAGCSSHGKATIAEGARLVKSGTGSIDYTAKSAGTVYVLDADQNRLVALGTIRAGQTARTDVANGAVMIDDKVVTHSALGATKRYQIYFRPDR